MTSGAPRELLTGFGRAAPSASAVVRPSRPAELGALVGAARERGATLLARGLGRSYGDAAQCAGGTILDCTALDAILGLDTSTGIVRVGAGCSLDALLRVVVPRGWFVPVTPGTRYVTVGGAIAADVHGKNHHVDGSFGRHVPALTLVNGLGRRVVTPGPAGAPPGVFEATAGGMGMTGVIEEADVRLVRIETSRMAVDTERAADLDDCMARMAARDADFGYSVAWIDCLATRRRLGRSVITWGDHARVDQLPVRARSMPLAFDPGRRIAVGVDAPSMLLNRVTGSAFNEAWFRRAPVRREGEITSISHFFHPLDAVAGWNRLYGPRGFTQYQFVVPFGAEAALREVLERLAGSGTASFLGVLKRFGAAAGPLSFPLPGWTLALDVPLGRPGLGVLLDGLDQIVADAGGRVYLAKDGRVRPELVTAMYPEIEVWRSIRSSVDPDGLFVSDLGRRLGLVEPA